MDSSTEKSLFVPGAIIGGRYEVIDTLGSGGMGTVVRVIDRALDGEVLALKLLYPHMAQDDTQFARFRNEVLIARKLAHPNIVRLFDFGAAGQGYYFISMEYVRGGCLSERIYASKEDRLSFTECLEILYEICLGLASAHSYGVVHRDLKPDNILMTETGQVKVSDFGLARSVGIERGLTATGDTVGTPYYMAPEQLKGEKLDHRVDLYALGIVAYEMVMGKRPFIHDTYLTLATMHFRQPIPKIASKESGIPQWFEEFVERLAAKKREDRYNSAEEAAAVLIQHMGESKAVELTRKPAVYSLYDGPQFKQRKRSKLFKFIVGFLFLLVGVVVIATGYFLKDSMNGNVGRMFGSQLAATTSPENVADPQFFTQLNEGDKGMVEFFLNSGADPSAVDTNGVPALHHAISAKQKTATLIDVLGTRGVLPDARDAEQATALIRAAQLGKLEGARALLRLRANPNAKDASGKTALHYAAIANNVEFVKLLLANGGRVGEIDSKGQPAAHYVSVRSPHRRALLQLLEIPKATVSRSGVKLSTAKPSQADKEPLLDRSVANPANVELRFDKRPKFTPIPGLTSQYRITVEVQNPKRRSDSAPRTTCHRAARSRGFRRCSASTRQSRFKNG